MSGSGISWAICKSAPCSRLITLPAPHHSVFFSGQMPFLPPNQQHQSTEGLRLTCIMAIKQWSGQHIRILCSYDLLNVRHLTLYLYAFVLQLRLKLLAIILRSFFTLLWHHMILSVVAQCCVFDSQMRLLLATHQSLTTRHCRTSSKVWANWQLTTRPVELSPGLSLLPRSLQQQCHQPVTCCLRTRRRLLLLRLQTGYCYLTWLDLLPRHTHTHPFNGPLSGTTQVSWYQKEKPIWILLKQETVSGSGISWAICKSAPRSRQITMPAPHHSVFYRPGALPAAQPTASKHWRQFIAPPTMT